MKHPSYDESCNVLPRPSPRCRHCSRTISGSFGRMPKGIGIPRMGDGVLAAPHAGIAYLDDVEAANFGPAMRHFARTARGGTGALRTTLPRSANAPHFHGILVPRYAKMPNDVKAGVFDLAPATEKGEVAVDESAGGRGRSALQ